MVVDRSVLWEERGCEAFCPETGLGTRLCCRVLQTEVVFRPCGLWDMQIGRERHIYFFFFTLQQQHQRGEQQTRHPAVRSQVRPFQFGL